MVLRIDPRAAFDKLIGSSPAIHRVFEVMEKVAPTDATVLLTGETGTGKELVARAIHNAGPRKPARFVAQNCGALPDTLLESELFGHKRGAFTGAHEEKKGLFELAHGGTIFLDEIGETNPGMQVRLLRVLQDGEIRPLGASDVRKVDVRVIAATNRDLRKMVQDGGFRQDLYYRLRVVEISIPPLRERREDIPQLAHHFLEDATKRMARAIKGFTNAAMDRLVAHEWSGNVRELENEIERIVALAGDADTVTVEMLSEDIRGYPTEEPAVGAAANGADVEAAGDPTTARLRAIVEAALSEYEDLVNLNPEDRTSRVFTSVRDRVSLVRAEAHNRKVLLRRIVNYLARVDGASAALSMSTAAKDALAMDVVVILGRRKAPEVLTRPRPGMQMTVSECPPEPPRHPHKKLVRDLLEQARSGGNNHLCVPASPGLLLDYAIDSIHLELKKAQIPFIEAQARHDWSLDRLLGAIYEEFRAQGVVEEVPPSLIDATWVKNRLRHRGVSRALVVVNDIDCMLNAVHGSSIPEVAAARIRVVKEVCGLGVPVLLTSIRPVRAWAIHDGLASAKELKDATPDFLVDDWDGYLQSFGLGEASAKRLAAESCGSPRIFEALLQGDDIGRLRQDFALDLWDRLPDHRDALALCAEGRVNDIPQHARSVLQWARVLVGDHATLRVADPKMAALWAKLGGEGSE